LFKRALIIVFLLFVVSGLRSSQAQGADWVATFYVEAQDTATYTAQLLTINANSIERITAVPPQLSTMSSVFRRQVLLSPDARYMVLIENADSVDNRPVRIADLAAGRCCFEVSPLPFTQAFFLGSFEPGGSRFALSYIGNFEEAPDEIPVGGMMVIDAATGFATQNVFMETDVNPVIGTTFSPWAVVGEWTGAGIRFLPNCFACEGVFEGEYFLWQPDSNQFFANSDVFFSIFGRRLAATGEVLYWEQDQRFPFDARAEFLPVPNVITYYADGQLDRENAPVVYFESDAIDIRSAYWVADGQAMLVASGRENRIWDVKFRDGTTRRILPANTSEVLGGTPDGWLALEEDAAGGKRIVHYRANNDVPTLITQFDPGFDVRLVISPELGASLASPPTAFASLSTPSPAALATAQTGTAITCPGFLPSRLVPGQLGRVTPGTANNLRSAPSTNAAVVSIIPGEAIFEVLSGPVCDELNRLAWWEVRYAGTIGWTAEGQAETYFTEPLAP